jgi:hypothetical protein
MWRSERTYGRCIGKGCGVTRYQSSLGVQTTHPDSAFYDQVDCLRVRLHSGGTSVRLLRGPSPSSSTVRRPVAFGWALTGAVAGLRPSRCSLMWENSLTPTFRTVAGELCRGRSTGCGCQYPARHEGLGEAPGRPKKMEATCRIDHKRPYNENLPLLQSWGCLVSGHPPWRFRRVGLNKS